MAERWPPAAPTERSSSGTPRPAEELSSLANGSPVTGIAYSPDGKFLASGDQGGMVKLWDLAAGSERILSKNQFGPVSALAFAPDGKTFVTAHRTGQIKGWDPVAGTPADKGKVPGAIQGLAISSDSRYLATANANGTIYVLRLASYRPRKKP